MKIKLSPGATAPTRATGGSAGYDLYSAESLHLAGGERALVSTGVSIAVPTGYVGLLFARSGMAWNGVNLGNSVGVIDSDYTGEIKVMLNNYDLDTKLISAGQRVAQLVLVPIITPELEVVDELDETGRADGAFGSTGA